MLQSKRRFWVLSIVVTTIAGAVVALASIILHYTEMGDDQYGCRPERLMMGGKMNTNQYCTREIAACRYQPKFIKKKQYEARSLTSLQVVVKWLQVILIFNALIILALFSTQARLRRTSRAMRLKEPLPEAT
jgi:hypothetical protein